MASSGYQLFAQLNNKLQSSLINRHAHLNMSVLSNKPKAVIKQMKFFEEDTSFGDTEVLKWICKVQG